MLPFLGPNVNKLKTKRDIDGLAKLLVYPKDPAVRREAAHALRELNWESGDDGAAMLLLACGEWVKCAGLGERGVSVLIQAAESWDRESRLAAIDALSSVSDAALATKVEAVLEHLAAERDKGVSAAAAAARDAYAEQILARTTAPQTGPDATIAPVVSAEGPSSSSATLVPVPPQAEPSAEHSEMRAAVVSDSEPSAVSSQRGVFDNGLAESYSTISISQIGLGDASVEERVLTAMGGDEAQSSLVSSLLRGHVVRETPSAILDQHVSGDAQVLLVSAPTGTGKSALLANWLVRFHQMSEKALSSERPLVLGLFCGADRSSTEGDLVLGRIAAALGKASAAVVPSVVPLSSQVLFATALSMAAASRPVVLVIDGVDLIEWRSGDRSLSWVPQALPPTARLILSSGSATHASMAAERGWDVLTLEPVDALERRDMFSLGLGSLLRRLSPAQMDSICSSSDSGLPLYLRLVIDEIAAHNAPQDIGDFLDDIGGGATVQDLFGKLFRRTEKRGERGFRGLIGDALSSLWVSDTGLSPFELRQALSAKHGELGEEDWAVFENSIRGFVRKGATHWYLANDHVRAAVSRRYLTGDEQQRKAHDLLARCFDQAPAPQRVRELAWHYRGSGETEKLLSLLSDPAALSLLFENDRMGLVQLWAELESQGQARLEDACPVTDEEPILDKTLMWRVGVLLHELGHHAEAAKRMGAALPSILTSGANIEEAWRLGESLRITGDWRLALDQMGQADRALAANGSHKARALLLQVMSRIQAERGRLMDAVRYIDKAEDALTDAGLEPDRHLVAVMKAELLLRLGNPAQATQIGREVEIRSRQNGNSLGLVRSLRLQSEVCAARGDGAKAAILIKEATNQESRLGLVTSK